MLFNALLAARTAHSLYIVTNAWSRSRATLTLRASIYAQNHNNVPFSGRNISQNRRYVCAPDSNECGIFVFATTLATEVGLTTVCAQPKHKLKFSDRNLHILLHALALYRRWWYEWTNYLGKDIQNYWKINEWIWMEHTHCAHHIYWLPFHHQPSAHIEMWWFSGKRREDEGIQNIRDDLLNFDMMCDWKMLWILFESGGYLFGLNIELVECECRINVYYYICTNL